MAKFGRFTLSFLIQGQVLSATKPFYFITVFPRILSLLRPRKKEVFSEVKKLPSAPQLKVAKLDFKFYTEKLAKLENEREEFKMQKRRERDAQKAKSAQRLGEKDKELHNERIFGNLNQFPPSSRKSNAGSRESPQTCMLPPQIWRKIPVVCLVISEGLRVTIHFSHCRSKPNTCATADAFHR